MKGIGILRATRIRVPNHQLKTKPAFATGILQQISKKLPLFLVGKRTYSKKYLLVNEHSAMEIPPVSNRKYICENGGMSIALVLVYWLCNPNDQVHNCAIAFGCTSGVKLPKHLTGMWWSMAGQPVWSGLSFPWRSPKLGPSSFTLIISEGSGYEARGGGDRWPIIFHQAIPGRSNAWWIDFWFGYQKPSKTKVKRQMFFSMVHLGFAGWFLISSFGVIPKLIIPFLNLELA